MVELPRFRYLVAGCVLLWVVLFVGADLLLVGQIADPSARAPAVLALRVTAGVALAFLVGLLLILGRLVLWPLELLAREVRIIARVNPGHEIGLPGGHLLGEVPDEINELGRALWRAQREVAEAVSAGSIDLERNKARLEDILLSLREGVLVCDDRMRIMFYNPAAKRVFRDSPALGLGRPLSLLCAVAPIENSLQILRRRKVREPEGHAAEGEISFVCSGVQGGILSCRVRLLPAVPGLSWSFLLTCEDISREDEELVRREGLLRAAVRQMRAPLANLSLAVESLELLPELGAESRATLEHSLAEEARSLVARFDILAREVEEAGSPRYRTSDVLTEDLIASVTPRLETRGIRLTVIGDPLWVRADVHDLLFLLEYFAAKIHEFCAVSALEVESLLGDKRVYFTFCWAGPVVPQAEIQRWTASIVDPPGVHTVAEVLERHASEVWSRPHTVPGFSVFCLPMPVSPQRCEPGGESLPARPVYVDFALREEDADRGRLEDLPLERVSFVVFDTETTGLGPLEGDEIVSLAGVKIVNRGVVLGESFSQLVNPGRGIPAASVRFHGITEEMVRDKPSVEQVLRDFQAFVGDAVLVGHNAAFDLRFIRMKEERAGVHLRGPVVDTLPISRFLHDHTPEHSLDAVARRLGVGIRDRHTALGDSLITAQIFLKFLYLLEERGITTLRGLLELSRR